MSSFYIISNKEKSRLNQYKIGIHSGSKNDLINRYGAHLHDNLLETSRGNKSEWVQMDLGILIRIVEYEIITHNEDYSTRYECTESDHNFSSDNERKLWRTMNKYGVSTLVQNKTIYYNLHDIVKMF